MYPLENFFENKAERTVDGTTLLVAATPINRKKHANPATTITSLATKLSLYNKNLVAALKDNVCLERLLRKFRICGRTSEKMGTGGSLDGTHD